MSVFVTACRRKMSWALNDAIKNVEDILIKMSSEKARVIETLVRLHTLPEDLKLFFIYMGEYVQNGEPTTKWMYDKARANKISGECVSKVSAFARRYCKQMKDIL